MPFKGRDMLLKIADGISPPTFTTVAGLRTNTLSVNNETVDVSTDDDVPWRQLMADTGMRSVSTSAGGVFKDEATINEMENLSITGDSVELQLVFGNGDMIQGVFQLTSFEHGGEHNTEQTYTISIESKDICSLIRA